MSESRSRTTCGDVRQQILSNATKLFPKIVSAYLKDYNVNHAKAGDIFAIITTLNSHTHDHEYTASLTYGPPPHYRVVLAEDMEYSRYEALANILKATEVLLKKKVGDARKEMDDRRAIGGSSAIVDQACL